METIFFFNIIISRILFKISIFLYKIFITHFYFKIFPISTSQIDVKSYILQDMFKSLISSHVNSIPIPLAHYDEILDYITNISTTQLPSLKLDLSPLSLLPSISIPNYTLFRHDQLIELVEV